MDPRQIELAHEGLQRDALRMLGCDEMQGYLFGQPLDAETAEAVLRQGGGALVG